MKKEILLFGEYVSVLRIGLAVCVALCAILIASTIGEFVVSVDNRYSVYPVGTDTNMYGNSAIGQGWVCLLAASYIAYLLVKKLNTRAIFIAIFLFFILGALSAQFPSFIPEDWCRYELTMYSCGDGLGNGSSGR